MTALLTQAASAEYYLGQMASWRRQQDHYNGGIEVNGRWWNPDSLFGLEDDEPIDPYLFKRLHDGFGPDGETRLSLLAGSARFNPGIDIMFAVERSLSALWAMTRDDIALRRTIEECQDTAVRAALSLIVRRYCAQTRIRTGKGQWKYRLGQVLAATFRHSTNRENHPHLHTHCVIFNGVQVDDHDRMRALVRHHLYIWRETADAIYHNALAAELRGRLGIRVERQTARGRHWRVITPGINLEQIWTGQDRIAVRTAQAETNFDVRGFRWQDDIDCPPLSCHFAKWFEDASRHGDVARCLSAIRTHDTSPTPDEQARAVTNCNSVLEDVSASRSQFRLRNVIEHVAHRLAGLAGPETALREAIRLTKSSEVISIGTPSSSIGDAHEQHYIMRLDMAASRKITALASALIGRTGHAIESSHITATITGVVRTGVRLSQEQSLAVRQLASSSGGLVMTETAPGTEYGPVVPVVADIYRNAGYRILSVAEDFATAATYASDYSSEATTTAWILRASVRQPDAFDRHTLIIVNEAEMLSPPLLTKLLRFAEGNDSALLFSSIPGSVSGVAGTAAINLVRQVLQGVRQIPASIGPQTEQPAPTAMPTACRAHGPINQVNSPSQQYSKLVEDWTLSVRSEPEITRLVLTADAASARTVSQLMRQTVLSKGNETGSHRVEVVQGYGRKRRTAELSLATGDHLRIGARNRTHGLFRGDILRVQSVSLATNGEGPEPRGHADRVHISGTTRCGRAVTFRAGEIRDWYGMVRISHGYADSIRAGARLPSDKVFLLVDQQLNPAASDYVKRRHSGCITFYMPSPGQTIPGLSSRSMQNDHIAALPPLDLSFGGLALRQQISRELALRDVAERHDWQKALLLHDNRIGQIEKQAFSDGSYVELDRDPVYRRFNRQRQARARSELINSKSNQRGRHMAL